MSDSIVYRSFMNGKGEVFAVMYYNKAMDVNGKRNTKIHTLADKGNPRSFSTGVIDKETYELLLVMHGIDPP